MEIHIYKMGNFCTYEWFIHRVVSFSQLQKTDNDNDDEPANSSESAASSAIRVIFLIHKQIPRWLSNIERWLVFFILCFKSVLQPSYWCFRPKFTLFPTENNIRSTNSAGDTLSFIDLHNNVYCASVLTIILLQSDLYSISKGVLVRKTTRKNPSIYLGAEFKKVKTTLLPTPIISAL